MYTYLDESGDAGFEFKRGSSLYFVVVVASTPDPEALHACIESYRVQIQWPRHREFKFVAVPDRIAVDFLREIARQDVAVRAAVINKQRLRDTNVAPRNRTYGDLVRMAVSDFLAELGEVRLVIDESFEGKSKKASFSAGLRQEVRAAAGTGRVRLDIVYRSSRGDAGLQMADMVAGALHRAYKTGDERYRAVLAPILVRERVLPEPEKE